MTFLLTVSGILMTIAVLLCVYLMIHTGMFGNTLRHILANNYNYSVEGNEQISQIIALVEAQELTIVGQSRATLELSNGVRIWVANYPYACYHVYNDADKGYRLSLKNFLKMDKLFKEYTS